MSKIENKHGSEITSLNEIQKCTIANSEDIRNMYGWKEVQGWTVLRRKT